MKFRRNKKDFFEFENDRKTHVKLYKAGKQWVSSLISSIGLIRVFKGKLDKSTMNTQLVSKEKDKKSEDKLSSDGITAALKGAAALGAVAGGTVLTANTALADTKQLDSNQNLVNKDTVNLSSGSGSSSTSDSLSTSESNTQSTASVSKSESVSLDTNSSSTSETRSDSNSRSESISESKSDSNSQSVSSQTTSKSESLASTSLENSQTTTGTTAKDKLQGLINQATDFVNSDAFKSSSSDLKTALAATVKQYATVMQSSTSLTEQDYQYGIDNLALLMNEIKTPSSSIKPNILMANVQTNSSLGTPDTNTKPGDTPAYWGVDVVKNKEGKPTTNNYKWIAGDKNNRLWWDINAYTTRNIGQTTDYAKNNVNIQTKDLGNGKTEWTVTFYPNKGMWYKGYNPLDYGLRNGQMGFYLTKDYKIISDVNVHISLQPGTTYSHLGNNGLTSGLKVRNSPSDLNSGDVNPENDITFKPENVNKTNGVISDVKNDFYQYGRYADIWHMSNSDFDNSVFSGKGSYKDDKIGYSFAHNNEFDEATVRDKQNTKDIVVNTAPFTTGFNKDTIGTAMYFQSWGDNNNTMNASFTVTFTTQHSNADQANLAAGNYNGAFSGGYAIINSWQDSWTNLQGQLVGQEVYNLKIDDKGGTGTIDPKIPNSLTSESTRESESASKSSSESASKSSSESASTSQSQSESKSASTSSSMSESLSTSSSLSESLSTSSSLSESLSTSSSLSESLSTSSSLSESLSTSSSLSESLSTSSSLSESLSTSSSLSESLSTSSSLSESLSTSSSLSESLSTSSSLSESLSTSSSLSESLSTSSSLSGSSSMNTDESDSISRSLSESESLSTSISSSLSESLSVSSSLSGSSSMNTDELDSISRSLSESESLSTSSSLSASASLVDSLSESLSNTISSENMNDGNMIATTNPGAVNKVSSDSLKHTVQRKELPQTGDSSTNAGVLGGLFVLTSLALMKAKKKKD